MKKIKFKELLKNNLKNNRNCRRLLQLVGPVNGTGPRLQKRIHGIPEGMTSAFESPKK